VPDKGLRELLQNPTKVPPIFPHNYFNIFLFSGTNYKILCLEQKGAEIFRVSKSLLG
jgi:hypothetical protein